MVVIFATSVDHSIRAGSVHVFFSSAAKDLAVHTINRLASVEKTLQELKEFMMRSHIDSRPSTIPPNTTVAPSDVVIVDCTPTPPALQELAKAIKCEDAFVLWYKHRIWEYKGCQKTKRLLHNVRTVVCGIKACLAPNTIIPARPQITGNIALDEANSTKWLGTIRLLAVQCMDKFLLRCADVHNGKKPEPGRRNCFVKSSVSSRAKDLAGQTHLLDCTHVIDNCYDA